MSSNATAPPPWCSKRWWPACDTRYSHLVLSPILAVLAASALAKPVAAEPEPALPPAQITLRVDVPISLGRGASW